MSTPQLDDVVLEARNIVKTYGGTRALKGVNFQIRRGTVTTLFGENGAGKSTLMKILYGVQKPDEGTIEVGGERVTFSSPSDAITHGIGMVFQHFQLADNLTPLVNAETLAEHPDLEDLLNAIGAELSTEILAELNRRVDVDRELPEDVAADFVTEAGLVG